jgi:hypothetical protein
VRELVDDDVVAAAGHLCVAPGNQQRSAVPGLARGQFLIFVDDAEFVLDAARDDELVGVDDDPDPAR